MSDHTYKPKHRKLKNKQHEPNQKKGEVAYGQRSVRHKIHYNIRWQLKIGLMCELLVCIEGLSFECN